MMIPHEAGMGGTGSTAATPSDTGGGFDFNALVSGLLGLGTGIAEGVTGAQIAEQEAKAAQAQAEAARLASLGGFAGAGPSAPVPWTPILLGLGVLGVGAFLLMR